MRSNVGKAFTLKTLIIVMLLTESYASYGKKINSKCHGVQESMS